ncbi:MAG: peptidoglycan editing factor PgeF [Psychromonas sp.]
MAANKPSNVQLPEADASAATDTQVLPTNGAANKPSNVQPQEVDVPAATDTQVLPTNGAANKPSNVQLPEADASAATDTQVLPTNGAANKPTDLQLLKPNWSAPAHIQAFSSTRIGGYSQGAYAGLNLGLHVADDPLVVCQNRSLLSKTLSLPENLCWLNQIHSTILLRIEQKLPVDISADASWTTEQQQPCIVMTADCLPVLITDKLGTFVCAVHAGWRGLFDGIIEKSIASICQTLGVNSENLLVWLGPCIGNTAFAVGDEVRSAFIADNEQATGAFTPFEDRWLADLHHLARLRLAPFQVFEISASEHCTYNEAELFYSYRRDNITGRMATLIWINETAK